MHYKAADRLQKFQTGIFAAMDEKKDAMIASGREIINLSIGTPDFKPAKHIMEAVARAVKEPFNYRYSLTDTPEVLHTLVDYYKNRYHAKISEEEITGVHGTQEGMGHLGLAMVNPGDVVLLPDPGYPIYEAGSLLAEAEIYFYGLIKENDFLPNMKEIPEDILKRAKFIVLSYPSNPVGAAAPREMYLEMIELARKYGFFIINDNAYSDIIFDGREGFSFLSLPGAKEVGVEFFSLSKSFNLTGFRLSYLIGNKDIIDALKLLRSQYDFGIPYPFQKAAVAALTGPMDEVHAQCQEYQRRRDALCGGLRKAGWNVPDSAGTMFVWLPVPEGYTSMSFVEKLMDETGIIGTPGTAFGPRGEGYIRFALVRPAEEMARIARMIGEALNK
ncbi:MAG: aminotransferase class I/II-fold pyridoxal phosphate-dependent enzyme [Eubacterium sp.]|nr:aminotransferase class I/II-fold pyridoxal phosphate-dependent enzyme [Eubacterium sp.]